MGQLIFCGSPLADTPYYMESVSKNIYSLEEMSYYLIHNAEVAELDFMEADFCEWVRVQMKDERLALKLRESLEHGAKPHEFAEILLCETGYATEEEIRKVLDVLVQMEEKDELQQCKIRADRLLKREKYTAAMEAYQWILKNKKEETQAEFLGNISHNLGTAYAKMFLFTQAAEYFQRAYEQNTNPESLKEELICLKLADEQERLEARLEEYQIGEEVLKGCERELEEAEKRAEGSEAVQKLWGFCAAYEKNPGEAEKRKLCGQIGVWRQEYERYGR